MGLADLIADADLLLALPPEQVGKQLLVLAEKALQGGIFSKDAVAGSQSLFDANFSSFGISRVYPSINRTEILLAVGEAWQWLEHAGLIMPAQSPNQSSSRLTRLGMRVVRDDTKFDQFVAAAAFSKEMLHRAIADEVWIQLAMGKLDVAVFIAFRAVEESVRGAANFEERAIGVDLMRRAFHPEHGPLTDLSFPFAEREALASLFAGAMGSYKNPHSHRTVGISDAKEAQEIVLLASHLLRIVDSRRP